MENKQLPDTLKEALEQIYGCEDTLKEMRSRGIADNSWHSYVWVKADEFALSWLNENGYYVFEEEIEDDCIGYACKRKGEEYAIFFYAYGERKTAQLDGEYCSKLKKHNISKNRTVLINYLHVKKSENDGKIEYKVGGYGEKDNAVETWTLKTVNQKDILLYYPRKEMMDLLPRFMTAYNTKDYDILSTICTLPLPFDAFDSPGISYNDGSYCHLAHIMKEKGKMKEAYLRVNDVVYCTVPHIEGYGYVGFTVNQNNKIDSIKIYSDDNEVNDYKELLVTDKIIEHCDYNDIPKLLSAEFLEPDDFSRFSIRLTFENNEIKRYDLKGDFESGTVFEFRRKTLTEKIFKNGKIVNQLKPYSDSPLYAPRGQGIEFITGSSISTVELYVDSYPIEKFDYSKTTLADYFDDYEEDGFCVDEIPDLDPKNPLYLLDRNTYTAKTLPIEYQGTPRYIYPFCGGYYEGLIMVSRLDEIELQYHHNKSGCAGLWGWIDKDFNTVIEPKYIFATHFENGKAIVCKGTWDIKISNGQERYWCKHEHWGVIDKEENELVPCAFDEISEIEASDNLYIVHKNGWENGNYAVYDINKNAVILDMDFDYDPGYMFNRCFVTENNVLFFDIHLPGEEKDLIYAYDLTENKYLSHGEEVCGRELNGETKIVVNRDGEDIIVF